jgi:hypothetical protein
MVKEYLSVKIPVRKKQGFLRGGCQKGKRRLRKSLQNLDLLKDRSIYRDKPLNEL